MAPVQSNSQLKPTKAPATINLTDKERKYIKVITSQLFGVIEVLKKMKNLLDFSPVLKHPIYAIFVLIYSLFSYNFVAWAIFLVPFGKSIGLSPEAAVILSTAGGLGGLVGKLAVFFLFYFRKMNSMTSSLVPALMAFVGLTGYLFSINYAVLLLSSGAFGFSCAYSDTALCGLIPRYICKTHLKQGTVLSYLFSGIFAQLGGIMSGELFL
ncbi:hypothetical protein HOLleu_05243 [Holothuria leucospilota]|uniref:Uncharacterized protein n=1 Tax=Holothuria leucospilota TaxID=206669 RepID=A0A9Q1HIU4_HOLLE|nr:hypothetical protein HOLleu_05243 [Holothuria leucospilota]